MLMMLRDGLALALHDRTLVRDQNVAIRMLA